MNEPTGMSLRIDRTASVIINLQTSLFLRVGIIADFDKLSFSIQLKLPPLIILQETRHTVEKVL
jgi:hypothetical protein